jgi:deoxyribonuclease V
MKYKPLHPWNVSPQQAIKIQRSLVKNICLVSKLDKNVTKIAGVDVSFRNNQCCAAICILTYPELSLLEEKTVIMNTCFPYVPTLLTFREGPVVLKCFQKIKTVPDVILFDGQGITHPRKMGLATHLGIWLETPAIGCAKTPLYGSFTMPALTKGSYSLIKEKQLPIGAVVRTKNNTKPIFVSQGYGVTIEEAIKITLSSCTKYKIPEPLRAAHTLSKTTLKTFHSS